MNERTPREILKAFYAQNHLEEDGGQNSPSVKIEISPKFHFYIPNFDARKKAVVKHDIHHLLTGYKTTVFGESEISAWEIAAGCKGYWLAFLINTSGVMLGIPLNLFSVLKAFSRGRRTRSLYDNEITDERALDMKLQDLRSTLHLDKYTQDTKPTFADVLLFLAFLLWGAVYSIASLALLPFVVFYTVYIKLNARATATS